MPKIRALKPETWTDDKFVRLSPLARLLYMGMWTWACDNGHVEDSATQLKMRILPMDDCDVEPLIGELISGGQVTRNNGYLKVVRLTDHQRPDMRYLQLCDHCKTDENTAYTASDKVGRPSGTQRAHIGRTKGARGAHNGPTTGAPRRPMTDGDGDGDKRSPSSTVVDGEFEDWWQGYPRKVDKGHAKKAYRTARKKASADELLTALAAYAKTVESSESRFIPHASTWLNGERWTDGPLTEPDPAETLWAEPQPLPEDIFGPAS